MKCLYILVLISFSSLPIIADEKEIAIVGKAHHWLIGDWSGATVATDPKFHVYFNIDNKGNIKHLVYTGWDQDAKVLIGHYNGVVDLKQFDKDRKVTLTSKKGNTKIILNVKFINGGAKFLHENEDHNLYDHIVFKRVIRWGKPNN